MPTPVSATGASTGTSSLPVHLLVPPVVPSLPASLVDAALVVPSALVEPTTAPDVDASPPDDPPPPPDVVTASVGAPPVACAPVLAPPLVAPADPLAPSHAGFKPVQPANTRPARIRRSVS